MRAGLSGVRTTRSLVEPIVPVKHVVPEARLSPFALFFN